MTTALPKVSPLVLKPPAAAFDNPEWLFELKYDGFRALPETNHGGFLGPLPSRSTLVVA